MKTETAEHRLKVCRGQVRLAIGLVAVACAFCACTAKRVPVGSPTPPPADGFIDLLDAEHAPRWRETQSRNDIFDIREGLLHIPGSYGPLKYVGYMGETFRDFELHLEFKLTSGANSGVILRGKPEAPHLTSLEVQVLDSFGEKPDTHSCGAIYDVVTPMFEVTRPAGEWNSYDITYTGRHIIVVLNGWKIIDTDFSNMTEPIGKFDLPYARLPLEGHLFLQDHHREVWYRNIRIRPL